MLLLAPFGRSTAIIGIIFNWDISTTHPPLLSISLPPPPPPKTCDSPYDFMDKGDNMLTTHLNLKTKEIDFNTLTMHTRAHFTEPTLLSHSAHYKQYACIIEK